MSKRMSIWWVPALAVLCVAIGLAIGIPLNNQRVNQCEERGGHIGPKNLCLTPDGRVIEW